jgi:hypothetical protein
VPNLPSSLSDVTKLKNKDIPVFALIPKAILYELKSEPLMLKIGNIDALAALQLIGKAAAIIREA